MNKNFHISVNFSDDPKTHLGRVKQVSSNPNLYRIEISLPKMQQGWAEMVATLLHEIGHVLAKECDFSKWNSVYEMEAETEAWSAARLIFEDVRKTSLQSYATFEAKKVLGYEEE